MTAMTTAEFDQLPTHTAPDGGLRTAQRATVADPEPVVALAITPAFGPLPPVRILAGPRHREHPRHG